MDPTTRSYESNPTHSASISEVKDSASRLLRSEFKLAAAEIKQATGNVKAQSKALLIGVGAALLGLLPFMAFLVIGLGDALDNYWLSSLIVFFAFTGIGGAVAFGAIKKLKSSQLDLPRTRHSLSESADGMSRAAHKTTHSFRRTV